MSAPGSFGNSATRVLLAVVDQRRPTVRSVAAAVGLSVSPTHRHLVNLRDDGLVGWDEDRTGTLHALVSEVAIASIPPVRSATIDPNRSAGAPAETGPRRGQPPTERR